MYQKDQGLPNSATYMHSKLYMQALMIIQMGDANVEAYNMAMEKIDEIGKSIAKVSIIKDVMSLEERSKINPVVDRLG